MTGLLHNGRLVGSAPSKDTADSRPERASRMIGRPA